MTGAITYERGSTSVDLDATEDGSDFEEMDQDGVIHRIHSQDWLVRREDLEAAGITPQAGDRIVKRIGAASQTYEVMSPGGQQVAKDEDGRRYTIRIHSKQVGG